MKKRDFTYSSQQKSIELDLSSNGFQAVTVEPVTTQTEVDPKILQVPNHKPISPQEKHKETKKRAFPGSSLQKSTKKTKKMKLGPILDDNVSRDDLDDDASYYYPPVEYEIPEREEAPEALIRSQNLQCAQTALEYYNKKNCANYELVDALASNAFIHYRGLMFHCNFTAKQKKSGTKLFFAELLYPTGRPGSFEASYCCILKGKRVVECVSCSAMHPDGFRKGLQGYRTYALRSHSH